MAADPKHLAALALHRFGFGPRAGSLASIAADPRGAILAELNRPGAGLIADGDLMDTAEAARAAFDFRMERKAQRLADRAEAERLKNEAQQQAATKAAQEKLATQEKLAAQEKLATQEKLAAQGQQDAAGAMASAAAVPEKPKQAPGPNIPQQIFLDEAKARYYSAIAAEIGFVERLTWFWSNHFCVSVDKGQVRQFAGAFEREAVRPHVLGKFSQMLLAVETHPAMLHYLDAAQSIGPNSIAGQRQKRGLNENLAREILELHTLGVNGGYTQTDVTRFANVITGWTTAPFKPDPEKGGVFFFNERTHEPGPQTVLGRVYEDAGFEQGRAVLQMLAHHPATAKHIAFKFARHFVADQPPPALVERLAKRFIDTGGDLKELARTLVTSQEAWDAPRLKLKPPSEWVIGSLRATGFTPPDARPILDAQNSLGEPLWRPPAPKGFPDESAAWMDGVTQRLDLANQLGRRVGGLLDPSSLADDVLGPLASAESRQMLARAESRAQAIALLLMTPEFLRR